MFQELVYNLNTTLFMIVRDSFNDLIECANLTLDDVYYRVAFCPILFPTSSYLNGGDVDPSIGSLDSAALLRSAGPPLSIPGGISTFLIACFVASGISEEALLGACSEAVRLIQLLLGNNGQSKLSQPLGEHFGESRSFPTALCQLRNAHTSRE